LTLLNAGKSRANGNRDARFEHTIRCFAVGAALPLLAVAVVSASSLIPVVSVTSLVFLAILGALAARVGGAGLTKGAMRVTLWGALAMALTAGIGKLFGTAV
jgi:VIT1/CCC1 family predicted Fe2+/Mn2+ transporter